MSQRDLIAPRRQSRFLRKGKPLRAPDAADTVDLGEFTPLETDKQKALAQERRNLRRTKVLDNAGTAYDRRKLFEEEEDDVSSSASEAFSTDTEDGDAEHLAGEHIFAKQEQLYDSVRKDPEDVQAWLALVDFQESSLDILNGDQEPLQPAQKAVRVAQSQIKLLRRALNSSTWMGGSSPDPLIIRLMKVREQTMSREDLHQEWESILARDLSSKIWMAWVDWAYPHDGLIVFQRALQALSSKSEHDIENTRVILLSKLCRYLTQAGLSFQC